MVDLPGRMVRRRLAWCAAVVVGVAAAGCGPDGFKYGAGGQGPGGRYQQVALSAQQEQTLGKEAFDEVLSKDKDHVIAGEEGKRLKAKVKDLGDKIFEQALHNVPLRKEINISDTDPYGTPWDFKDRDYAVLDTDEINAFCLPGGYVVVFKGLLDVTKDHDDWLATVLGHEIAHAVAHHASERVARQQMYGKASEATAGLDRLQDGDRWKLLDVLGVGLHVRRYVNEEPESPRRTGLLGQLQDLAFDRDQEEEADHIGVFLMAFADDDRYDPEQAVAFWEKMEQMQQEAGDQRSPPEILSDHPSDAHRIALMRHWAIVAIDARNAWKAGRVVTRARP